MSLSSFTSTFGLDELKKGFFPHLFHTKENEFYVGTIPVESYYDPDGMSSKKKEEFLEWYRTQVETGVRFVLKDELIAYRRSDVKLLKDGCRKFVNEFRSIAGFDPFEKCITIASACNRYWRKCHLPSRSVAVEPINGWGGGKVNHSKASLEWLHWCEHQLKSPTPRILHARNGGEQSIIANPHSYHVDGLDPYPIPFTNFTVVFTMDVVDVFLIGCNSHLQTLIVLWMLFLHALCVKPKICALRDTASL